ncbi:hypothetical protein LDJ79_00365 [Vibrio tritonius]|uniref:Uncharacterized protein n=1 Tax=Vibrio tritonius TaxID=1435069 RepID=A0ABS7YI39_9VIBR|nr:hypothetical protein [Vibrio tritonius]MCA2014541.1 hypothetical protein [Vibrio tritonius]
MNDSFPGDFTPAEWLLNCEFKPIADSELMEYLNNANSDLKEAKEEQGYAAQNLQLPIDEVNLCSCAIKSFKRFGIIAVCY